MPEIPGAGDFSLTELDDVRYNVHMNTTLPATKARQQFFKVIAAAEQPGHAITLTVNGEPKIVMMSVEDFEGWQETLEIMSDKKLMEGIRQGLKGKKTFTESAVKKKLGLE